LIKLGKKTQKSQEFPSILNSGGRMTAKDPSIITGCLEALITGKSSRIQSKMPNNPSLMTKFKR